MKVKFNKNYFIINYYINNEDVGELIIKPYIGSSHNYLYIQSLFVNEEYRKQGIGTKLMEKLISILPNCKKMYNVNEIICIAEPYQENISEEKLIQFYKNFGFKNEPRMKKKYLVMKI